MMRRKFLVAFVAAAATAAVPLSAFADSCANVSRAAAPQTTSTTGPTTKGNWVWLPSLGVPADAWGKAPPGTVDSQALGLPGARGNYTNGKTSSLLGVSANCPPGSNPNRQTTHGIQSGCA
jgi:hypothetical protein